MSFVTSFHNQLDSFLNFLIDNYPNENQFVIFKNFINNARKINSIQIIRSLYEVIKIFKQI